MKKKLPKSKEELKKIQEEYYNSIPEEEKNPNHLEDFDALLSKAVNKKPVGAKKKSGK